MKRLLVVTDKKSDFDNLDSSLAPEYGSKMMLIHITHPIEVKMLRAVMVPVHGCIMYKDWPETTEAIMSYVHYLEIPEYETINDFLITLNQ